MSKNINYMINQINDMKWIISTATLIAVFQNCATITSPSEYPIYVKTNPSQAKAYMTCNKERILAIRITPVTFFQSPDENCSIRISKDGYINKKIDIEKKINPAFWGNYWGLIFWFPVDILSGHWRRPEYGIIEVELKKKSAINDNKK